jgi:hypothetical protein
MFDRLTWDVRTGPASWVWFGAHGIALIILTLVTLGRGMWFWTIGSVFAVSYYGGGLLLSRHARRSTATEEDGTGQHRSR